MQIDGSFCGQHFLFSDCRGWGAGWVGRITHFEANLHYTLKNKQTKIHVHHFENRFQQERSKILSAQTPTRFGFNNTQNRNGGEGTSPWANEFLAGSGTGSAFSSQEQSPTPHCNPDNPEGGLGCSGVLKERLLIFTIVCVCVCMRSSHVHIDSACQMLWNWSYRFSELPNAAGAGIQTLVLWNSSQCS